MRRNGFTLIEIMIVMMVMSLLATAVVLTADTGRRGVAGDVTRLASRIAAARETAIVSARPVGIWISRSGYGFDFRSDGAWMPANRKPFDTVDWPAGTTLAADGLAGRQAALSGGRMRLVFDNLGLPDAPMSLRIDRDSHSAQLAVAANGDVKVQ